MTWKIEPSFGVEAFVTEDFRIGLKQEQPGTDQTLIFSRDEIPGLIEILKSVSKEAEELYQQEVAND
ncbi:MULTISPECIES: hypothetical protein [Pseudomonas]|uniref:hypothetical protein n=1 Tax=Pseudomonas TaxID=286 RepID=UPI001070A80F|nr:MULTISPECIES: hypothetical protein [Pseudomonas]QBR31865.1 hypothetical protein E3Z29_15620 [Pseudomonas sp. S150]UZT95393.1 hypothetical protein OPS05_12740 [Pseudomonas koreensis]